MTKDLYPEFIRTLYKFNNNKKTIRYKRDLKRFYIEEDFQIYENVLKLIHHQENEN